MTTLFNRISALALAAALLAPTHGCAEKQAHHSSPQVKNVILLVGDGMGIAQITALALDRSAAAAAPINLERAAVGGFVKTESANNRVTDSAAAATAFATGQKTNNGYLGVDPSGAPLETLLEKAETRGMSTGLVATTHLFHATPGAFYAHISDRNDYEAIALALVDSGVDVAIGGGMTYLTERGDGRDLVVELQQRGYIVADTLSGLDTSASPAIAVVADKALPFVVKGRDPQYLTEATNRALDILTARNSGFFLMVEGSLIDYAGHDNDAAALLPEMRDFDNAVGAAFDYADSHPGTLVIVVADHETGGLSLPAGKENFLLPDSGVEFKWSTKGHSAAMVPMFAYGSHASLVGGIIDNTEINHRIAELLGLK